MPGDVKKLTPGEIVVVASGVLLLIFSFFDWYGASGSITFLGQKVDLGGFGVNGWDKPDAFFSIVAILIGIVMAAHVIATKVGGVKVPDQLPDKGWGLAHFVLGIIAFVFILLKLVMNTHYTKIGLYLGLLSSLGLAIGGFLIAKERGELPAAIAGKS